MSQLDELEDEQTNQNPPADDENGDGETGGGDTGGGDDTVDDGCGK